MGKNERVKTKAVITIYIVDDEPDMLEAMKRLLESVNLPVRTFRSAGDFLAGLEEDPSGCLLLDVRLPDMSGMEVQRILAKRGIVLPILFLTGYADVPMAVKAMQAGAVDFIEKPFNPQHLLDRVQLCLRINQDVSSKALKKQDARKRLDKLTERERDIAEFIVAGKPSKAIAAVFDISEKTVDVHRHNILKKVGAGSVAELVHLWLENKKQISLQ
jgi:two-component system, LuxR family, response regulator FixJ